MNLESKIKFLHFYLKTPGGNENVFPNLDFSDLFFLRRRTMAFLVF